MTAKTSLPLIPAKAGIQGVPKESHGRGRPPRPRLSPGPWVPAFAGMSGEGGHV